MPNRTNPMDDVITTSTMRSNSTTDPSILTTQQLWREIAALKELIITRVIAIEHGIELAHDDMVRFPTEIDKAVTKLKDLHDERFTTVETFFKERYATYEQRFLDNNILRTEQFNGVTKQFAERDIRFDQTHKDSKTAIDAALQAAEKAVTKQNDSFLASITKSEASTQKQIDAQGAHINSSVEALESKIGDMKERVLIIEGKNTGQPEGMNQRLASLEASMQRASASAGLPDELSKRTAALELALSQALGNKTGQKDFWGYIVGAIGLIATLIAIFAYLMGAKS